MHCKITLSRQNLLHNLKTFQDLVPHSQVMPIVKGNAYGHGIAEIYEILKEANPAWLGVNYLSEAEKLRSFGYKNRILIVGPVQQQELSACASLNIDVTLGSHPQLEAWIKLKNKPRAHIKFDTGMARQGFFPNEAEAIGKKLKPWQKVIVGVSSHFANVEDVTSHEYAHSQLKLFEAAKATLLSHGFEVHSHIASSSSSLLINDSHFDIIRLGISLYGLWPSKATKLSYLNNNHHLATLKPVMQWTTQVAMTKEIPTGSYVGYGCTFKSTHPMKLAVLPVGYYEGYPRLAQNGYVLIKGSRAPIVGRICMNMMTVDITYIDGVNAMNQATLIGEDGSEKIDAEDIATWAQTINYEIVTRLPADIPRQAND